MIRHLHREQFVPGEPQRIWDFFATPRNLDVLTPPDMKFRIVSEVPDRMYAGQLIEYRVGLLPGVWTRWLTEITQVREGEYFLDDQRIGPYRLWHHEHFFRPAPGGLHMTDHVTYDVGRGPFGALLERFWITDQLARIFDYRAAKIRGLFSAPVLGS